MSKSDGFHEMLRNLVDAVSLNHFEELVVVPVIDVNPDVSPGTRAENENVHQSFCALRPVWPGRHIGNAD